MIKPCQNSKSLLPDEFTTHICHSVRTSPHQGQISLYPSDTVQGSSRRTSHFPRVPDKSFSQQQPPAPHQHAAASAGTSPSRPPPQQLQQRKKQTLDPRPMNLLALDASLYAQPAPVAAPVNNMAAGQIPASASMPQFAAQAQQQQNPLAQASAAVALTA